MDFRKSNNNPRIRFGLVGDSDRIAKALNFIYYSKWREFDTLVCMLRCAVYNGRNPEDNKEQRKEKDVGIGWPMPRVVLEHDKGHVNKC